MCGMDWYRFGGHIDDYPHPSVDISGFMRVVSAANKREPKIFDPRTKKMSNWIDPSMVRKMADTSKCIVS